MSLPGLDVIKLDGVRIFGCKVRITRLYVFRVRYVFERIQLSPVGSLYSSGIVELQLIVGGQRVVDEKRRKEVEIIFVDSAVSCRLHTDMSIFAT